MKKLMIVSISLIALVGGSAVAADIPVNAPVYKSVPPTSFSWTGFYIGGHIGSGWGHKDWFEDTTQSGSAGAGPVGFRDASYDDFSGWLGGGQLGVNYQAGWVVWGVQADISAAHIIGSDNHCFPEVTGILQTCSTKINSLGTVTGRVGAAFDRGLVYVVGGWAWARENHDNFCNVCGLLHWTASETRSGWTVGVGGEYAFAGAWSAFLQYNYMNFGTRNDRFTPTPSGIPFIEPFTEDIRQNLNVVKVGLNYKFGSQAGLADSAFAADMPVKAPPAAWSWTGYYIGVHIGSAMGINTVADPFGPSIFGDEIHSPGYFGGAQIGFNWQAPGSPWVFGLEADASLANLDGTNTCFAFSGFSGAFNSLNCRAHTDALGTLTGRVGMAFGPSGRSLAYVKGGLGWASSTVDTIVNFENFGVVLGNTSHNSFTSVGWTAGAGIEYALMPHWTVKAEYDYLDLGSTGVVAASPSILVPPGVFLDVPPTKVSQQIHAFKLGINYKFGSDTAPFPSGAFGTPILAAGAPGLVTKAVPMPVAGWDVEVGARYWYSWGRFQKDLALGVVGPQNPTLNISRLTWDNLTSHAGEGFARINTPWNIFVKGIAGAGNINGGKINDEDWLAPTVTYSNTVGNASGHLNYWTIDGGFNIIHGPGAKLGVFVGYNEYRDNKNSFTCTQITTPHFGLCSAPIGGVLILSENDLWQSLRVGGNAEVMLTNQWKLAADVAFVPYTKFSGKDFHPFRPFVADQTGTGIGTQAEVFLSYLVTPQFSVGAGGRYWAMWTTSGIACREPPFGDCPTPIQNMQFKTERYGALLQASYKFW